MRSKSTNTLLSIIGAALFAAAILLLDTTVFCSRIQKFLGLEPFKIVLQFLLITVLGGCVFALVNARRDAEVTRLSASKELDQRRDVRVANLQAIDEKLQDAHRQMKLAKRRLRSRLDRTNPSAPAISKDDFRECMDQILKGQIAIEEVQDLIEIRRDLIDESEMKRLGLALHYPARYFHDVFEVFERGRITRENGKFVLNDGCGPLNDFLLQSLEDKEAEGTRSIVADESKTYEERHAALQRLEERGCRYGRAALASFRLASSELKSIIDSELRRGQGSAS